jgi:phosphonopyruvate decarboxylase
MSNIISNDKQIELFEKLIKEGYNFFCGVPDSCLKKFIHAIDSSDVTHVRASWEAEAISIATGAFLAGKKPCVYMQNAGLPFAMNPLTSLCIPCGVDFFLVIGHRHTLPQHKIMGEIDSKILEIIGWSNYVLVDHPQG